MVPTYAVRHRDTAPTVPCPCGESTRILTAADGAPCSVHVTTIREAERHYHRRTAEVYYILDGYGKIELDGDWHAVSPGAVVHIPAGCRHRIVAEGQLTTLVIATPPFDAADEFLEPDAPA
jgi:mannose-6-phosphate isomerase-like protein (cupin superfamily)